MDEVKDYPPYLDYPKPHKAQTNADRIRSMSDEELNKLFHDIYNAGFVDGVTYAFGKQTNNFEWSLKWLMQPAEEG